MRKVGRNCTRMSKDMAAIDTSQLTLVSTGSVRLSRIASNIG